MIVVQPLVSAAPNHAGPPYPSDHGVWQGKLPDVHIHADLREMDRLWEKGMDLPE